MTSEEVRKRFVEFFEARGHALVSSSSLVPEGDQSVLFTTAGMQQFKPYYLGAPSPHGNRVVSIQRCFRSSDIEEVGDGTHLTFFEMLGNFSFGDYWKEEAILWAHQFITKELGLTVDYVSVFKDAESGIPADEESRAIWARVAPGVSIRDHGKEDNFWGPTGDEGPCGPTTEIYVDGVEVWNIVFNEYYKKRDGTFEPLTQKGIDTGMGLERLMSMVQKKKTVYETDLFLKLIEALPEDMPERHKRILADHSRAISFLIHDGVLPAAKGAGYVLRRLLRRLLVQGQFVFIQQGVAWWAEQYQELAFKKIMEVVQKESAHFSVSLEAGMKELLKSTDIDALRAANLYTTYGLPLDTMKDRFPDLDLAAVAEELKKHQVLSRTSSAGMFKGGLANTNPATVRLHTAHHLLLAALQKHLGPTVKQRGSNITDERLRLDFSFDRKLSEEELRAVAQTVQGWIDADFPVTSKEMSRAEAEGIGAEMEFGAKYGEMVRVYFIGPEGGQAVSKEYCGGPHAGRTGELGTFHILKEEAVASGVRRIKATLV